MGTDDPAAAILENPAAEPDALTDETPAHAVVISSAFYMGETEVTQAQWFRVMQNRSGPDELWRGGSYHCPLHLIRPGYRSANPPGTRYEVLGFRIVAEPR